MNLLVVGSINLDFTIKVDRFPEVGETVSGGKFYISPGGKGLNQAVASARAGVKTMLVAGVGSDFIWDTIRSRIKGEQNLKIRKIIVDDEPTGCAFILVDSKGNVKISVAPGANHKLPLRKFEKILKSIRTNLILCQCEIPPEVVEFAVQWGCATGIQTILNPAPYKEYVRSIAKYCDFLIPNEIEALSMVGENPGNRKLDKKELKILCVDIKALGPKNVIITLGERGAVWYNGKDFKFFSAYKVRAVDTTAAGDIFCGYFSAMMVKGVGIEKAIRIAMAASALGVTRSGAYTSIPTWSEVQKFAGI